MEKTIQRGDYLVVDTYYYRSHIPARKDVIVFKTGETFFIKRVVAIGGDTISGRDGNVIINGQILIEPYVVHDSPSVVDWNSLGDHSMNNFGPITVPQAKYFVMGDNRDVSLDSRSEEVGLIDESAIIGKALFVYRSDRQGKTIQ